MITMLMYGPRLLDDVRKGLTPRLLADDELFDHRFIDHANEVLPQ